MKKLSLLATMWIISIASNQQAMANPIVPVMIDFGVSWPAYTGIGVGNYAATPYDLVRGVAQTVVNSHGGVVNKYSTATQIAALLNLAVGSSFTSTDISKTNQVGNFVELFNGQETADGYFAVPAGWNYLVVQYDGPNGGSVVMQLSGNNAKVPFDSSVIWGAGDQYAVSHYSVAGPIEITPPTPPTPTPANVPDGGTTAAMLGLSLLGMRFMFGRKA